MRFKIGSKVEVKNEKELLTWRAAEIISGNGHTYTVRYDCHPQMKNEVLVERIPRKFIRPCPPVEDVESWVVGDTMEVFNNGSWKIATVLKVYDGLYYMVRLLGLCHTLRVHKLSIRVRQSWRNDKWVVIKKSSRNSGDLRFGKVSTSQFYQRTSLQEKQANAIGKIQGEHEIFAIQSNIHLASSRTLKRASPYCSSPFEVHAGNTRKLRLIEKKDGRQGVPISVLEKVDAVSYSAENMGEKYMHGSFNNRPNGYNELLRRKIGDVMGCFTARDSEIYDSDSDVCSVGSCSAAKSLDNISAHMLSVPCQEKDGLYSDADSYCCLWEKENCSIPPEEEVGASIHRLELHAYHCTLEALFASGPLSWEKEELLTNLRILLHISNDEHLIELKNLISFGNNNVA